MKYKLLTNNNLDKFNKEVNEMLAAGWELHGTPFPCVTTFEEKYVGSIYAQAFTGDDSAQELEQQEAAEVGEDSEDTPF